MSNEEPIVVIDCRRYGWNRVPTEERFWAKVDKRGPDDCWEWIGRRSRDGYGVFRSNNAHIFAYELAYGPRPSGERIEIHHKCENKGCVNPAHLEALTSQEHRDKHGPACPQGAPKRTHCYQGHELTPENVYLRRDGNRECRICKRARKERSRQKHKQQS